jgi:ABC-2 type transport system permease protein
MIFTIALREFRNLFLSPLAWAVLAITQAILAWLLFVQIDQFFLLQDQLATLPNAPGVTDLVVAPVLEIASIMLLMITPLMTMRLLSEEQRNGTLSLLLSAPISSTEIILGKYLGIILFMLVFVCMIALMPLSLNMGTDIDMGKLAGGLLGLMLLLAAFSAAGLFMSSLTSNPVIAAVSTFGLLLLLWIIDSSSGGTDTKDSVMTYLSLLSHFAPLLRGIIDSKDIAYFALFIGGFVILTVRQLDAHRLQK